MFECRYRVAKMHEIIKDFGPCLSSHDKPAADESPCPCRFIVHRRPGKREQTKQPRLVLIAAQIATVLDGACTAWQHSRLFAHQVIRAD